MLDLLPLPAAYAPDGGPVQCNDLWLALSHEADPPTDLLAACANVLAWEEHEVSAVRAWVAMLAPDDPPLQLAAPLRCDRSRHMQVAIRRCEGALMAQMVEVTALLAAQRAAEQRLEAMLSALDSLEEGFLLLDADDRIVFCNRRYRELYAISADLITPGRPFAEFIRIGAERGQYAEAIGRVDEWVAERLRLHAELAPIEQRLADGRWIRIVERRTADGGAVGLRIDISDIKQAEELRRQIAIREEVIAAQAALLAELSTPLLEVGPRVLLAPMVGAFDSARAAMLIESLLQAVQQRQARFVVLDVTGVPVIDTQVAHAILQCATSVRLLGAQLVMTGIRPDVAQTLVALGVDLSAIITRADLRDGVQYALRRG
ncbi:PAS-domain containing protein [Chloroflexus sp.]|uniref:PAS-domain containing protein n=1 Tax=Chloroflexus sp. TaxID=1904827 RepID=UPI00298EDB82|nr:PAS-domain containing protein [Chloroflexus sp.]MCS6886631.1 PAS-domain containing protein [Chloroflexus sp.]MCX7858688.1 PAS-domain containing protein [Chloroflexus sp.]MDW8403451.1 PAS-domain containing protein [Chloroflexus sp.]